MNDKKFREAFEAMKPKKTEVWLVGTDDGWSGIYINGKRVHENHGISIRDFMDHLQSAGLAKDVDFKDGWLQGEEANIIMEDLGGLPDDFKNIEDNVS